MEIIYFVKWFRVLLVLQKKIYLRPFRSKSLKVPLTTRKYLVAIIPNPFPIIPFPAAHYCP